MRKQEKINQFTVTTPPFIISCQRLAQYINFGIQLFYYFFSKHVLIFVIEIEVQYKTRFFLHYIPPQARTPFLDVIKFNWILQLNDFLKYAVISFYFVSVHRKECYTLTLDDHFGYTHFIPFYFIIFSCVKMDPLLWPHLTLEDHDLIFKFWF